MWLTEDELRELTGAIRRSTQIAALKGMGIAYKRRPDGSVVVLRAHAEQMFGFGVGSTTRRRTSPDFSMVR